MTSKPMTKAQGGGDIRDDIDMSGTSSVVPQSSPNPAHHKTYEHPDDSLPPVARPGRRRTSPTY